MCVQLFNVRMMIMHHGIERVEGVSRGGVRRRSPDALLVGHGGKCGALLHLRFLPLFLPARRIPALCIVSLKWLTRGACEAAGTLLPVEVLHVIDESGVGGGGGHARHSS